MIEFVPQPLFAAAALPTAPEQRPYDRRQELFHELLKNNELLLKNRLEVRHLMSRDPAVVLPSTTLDEMTSLLRQRRLQHLLVCNRGGEVLGVINDCDLHGQHGATAQQLMSFPVLSIAPEMPLSPAITYLLNENVSCLPVIDCGRLCGVLTATDLFLTLQCMLQMWLRLAQVLQQDPDWNKDSNRANLVDPRADLLTGMSSRRGLEEVLDMLLAVHRRFAQPFSLAVVLIDHFRQISENCGDAVAKSLVKGVARLIEQSVRDCDLVARLHEDAFAVVMPQTDLVEANDFCSRLCETARQDKDRKGELRISASAVSPEPGEEMLQLLNRAQAALV